MMVVAVDRSTNRQRDDMRSKVEATIRATSL